MTQRQEQRHALPLTLYKMPERRIQCFQSAAYHSLTPFPCTKFLAEHPRRVLAVLRIPHSPACAVALLLRRHTKSLTYMGPPRSPGHISLASPSLHTTLPALLLGTHATLSNPHSYISMHLAQNIPILHLVSRCICHTCSNRTCLDCPHKVCLINAHKASINDTESMLPSEPCPPASVRSFLLHLTTTSSQQAAQAFPPSFAQAHAKCTAFSGYPINVTLPSCLCLPGSSMQSHSIQPQLSPTTARAMLLSLAHSGQYAPPRT